MTVRELKILLEKLRGVWVFHNEAVEILQEKYNKNSARVKLSELCGLGTIERQSIKRIPTLYKKKDIYKVIKES